MEIKKVALGNHGLVVPNIGLGCMGMTGFEEGHAITVHPPETFRF